MRTNKIWASGVKMLRGFGRAQSGSVAVIAAIALPVVLGMTGLVAEYGNGLLTRVENQRVSDLSAYAGAVAYSSQSGAASAKLGAAVRAAKRVAELNGVPAASVTPTAIVDGSAKVIGIRVDLKTTNNLILSRLVGDIDVLTIATNAVAQLGDSTPAAVGCIVALNGSQTGIILKGGTKISAPKCVVASANSIYLEQCGTSIVAQEVTYANSPPSGCAKNISGTIIKQPATDPLQGNTAIAAARSRIATVAAMVTPAVPSSGTGFDIHFGSTKADTDKQIKAAGCTPVGAAPRWGIICPSGGNYKFGKITIEGGTNVDFNSANTANYTFSDTVDNGSSGLKFGAGNFVLMKGLITGGDSIVSFGAGSFQFGGVACDGGTYSICNRSSGRLTFGGPSSFIMSNGIYSGGGTTLNMGRAASTTSNSFKLGASSNGNSLYVTGKVELGDTIGAGVFEAKGSIFTGGGSCLAIGAAAQHDIGGNVNGQGGILLGSGVYTIDGFFAMGAEYGGSVNCWGADVGVKGINITLVISGKNTATSSCAEQAFCLSAGYRNVNLTSPTSGSNAGLVIVGPETRTAGARFTSGASGVVLSGALYFPKGPITLDGGASLGGTGGAAGCLQLVGSQITLNAGTLAASECVTSAGTGTGAAGGSKPRLVS